MNDRILIVENDQTSANAMVVQIEKALDIEVDVAYRLSEAKLFIKKYDYFLILLDLKLPDAPNGEIVDYAIAKGNKVIVLTKNKDKELKKQILQKKIIDYINKKDTDDIYYVISKIHRLQKNRNNTILVVDDSMVFRKQLYNMLDNLFYNVITVAHGEEALGMLEVKPEINLVVTDYNMPVMDGLELTIEIRKKYTKTDLAIIALSSNKNAGINALFLKEGANDYISKPFSKEEFSCRIDNTIEALENIQALLNHANRDFLTGLYNRRYFYNYIPNFEKDALELGEHFSIAMIGIDDFENIQNKYGNEIAEKLTIHISNILISTTNYNDLVSIFSNSVFCLILKNTDGPTAITISKRLQEEIRESKFIIDDGSFLNISISVGVLNHQEDNIEETLDQADMMLYKAKENGTNQLVC